MRTLILMRHAKAEDSGISDHARVLSLRGRQQSAAQGRELIARVSRVDQAYVSDAARTKETFERLSTQEPELADVSVEFSRDIYDGGVDAIIDLIRGAGQAETVLVVGHEPVISSVAAYLDGGVGRGESDGLGASVRSGIPTATMCFHDVPGEWADLEESGAPLRAICKVKDDASH